MITLPEAFEQEMKQLLGEEEYEAYRKTFDEAVPRSTLFPYTTLFRSVS